MIRYIDHKKMGRGEHGWLDSHFHFSFAEYCNPDNVQFGVLRVLNDDLVQCGTGFDPHPHQDMEIISYVVNGELTHEDSMGNSRVLTRGQVQYMSAGTGVVHSEYNLGKELLRFLQIWIFPDAKSYKPDYGDHRFALEDRYDCWLHMATKAGSDNSPAPIRVHSDINAYATIVSAGKSLEFPLREYRQAYLILIEGTAELHGSAGSSAKLAARDAAEITGEAFTLQAGSENAHALIIEMARTTES